MFGLPGGTDDQEAELPPRSPAELAAEIVAILFAFSWLPGLDGLDRRRRTSQALRMFTTWARRALLVNAAALMLAYVSFCTEAIEYAPGGFAGLLLQSGRGIEAAAFGWLLTWFPAQTFVQTMKIIHRKLEAIALADH